MAKVHFGSNSVNRNFETVSDAFDAVQDLWMMDDEESYGVKVDGEDADFGTNISNARDVEFVKPSSKKA